MTVAHIETAGGRSNGVSEAVGGAIAVVLTILGLAHVVPEYLVAVALIAAGAALMLRGVATVGEYGRVLQGPEQASFEIGGAGALSVELLTGAAGVVLGILALLRVAPIELVAIGVIAEGAGLILSTGATSQLTGARIAAIYRDQRSQRLAGEINAAATSSQAAVGLTAVVLGILALAGFSSTVLELIALLALGAFILLNSASVGGTMLAVFRHG
jgi:hypothetical protein